MFIASRARHFRREGNIARFSFALELGGSRARLLNENEKLALWALLGR